MSVCFWFHSRSIPGRSTFCARLAFDARSLLTLSFSDTPLLIPHSLLMPLSISPRTHTHTHTHARMHAHTHARTCMHTCTHTRADTHAPTHAHTCTHKSVHMCTHTQLAQTYTPHTCTHKSVHMRTHTHTMLIQYAGHNSFGLHYHDTSIYSPDTTTTSTTVAQCYFCIHAFSHSSLL